MRSKHSTLGQFEGLPNPNYKPEPHMPEQKKKDKKAREGTVIQPLTKASRTMTAAHELGTTLSLVSNKSTKSSKSHKSRANRERKKDPDGALRRKPRAKRISMVGGMPHYRAVETADPNDEAMHRRVQEYPGLTNHQDMQLALAKETQKLPACRMLPESRFIPKKDFDTTPASLAELNPALPKMPYQPTPKNPDAILDRDYRHKMPMRKGKRSRLAKGKVTHVTNWNKETIKPKSWKPLQETPMYQNGHVHEYRALDRFISPKGWRLLHPEEQYPDSKKKDYVLKCIEDLRKGKGSQVKAITNGDVGALAHPHPHTHTHTPPHAPANQAEESPYPKAETDNVFLTQLGGGDSPHGTPSPAPPTQMSEVQLARTDTTFTEPEALPFEHGTCGKWDKFNSETWRARPTVETPKVLQPGRKPKFNPSRYVQKHKDKVVEKALRRLELIESGTLEPQLELPERIFDPEEHQKVTKHKKKIKWVSAVVQDLLKRVVRTENMKLTSLEEELHLEIRKGTQPAMLKGTRESIQTIRRRIADLREALAYVNVKGWQQDLVRLLVSSHTPLEQFLLDVEALREDDAMLQDDTPW